MGWASIGVDDERLDGDIIIAINDVRASVDARKGAALFVHSSHTTLRTTSNPRDNLLPSRIYTLRESRFSELSHSLRTKQPYPAGT